MYPQGELSSNTDLFPAVPAGDPVLPAAPFVAAPLPSGIAPAAALPVGFTTPTAARVAAAFLLSYRGNTRAAYAADLTHFGRWCAGLDVDVLSCSRAHLDAYVEQQVRDGAAAASIRRRVAAVAGFYAYAIDEGLADRNPAARVRRPAAGDNVQSTGLTAAEAGELISAAEAHSPRSSVIILLSLLLGLRVSELCAATVGDLGYQRGHRVLTVTRKGGRRQTMAVPPRAAVAIDAYVGQREEGPLLRTASGRGMDRQAVWRLIRKLAAVALPHLADKLHPHDLRHTCATLALDTGAALRDVQDLLGHADPRTTRRYDRARFSLDRSPSHQLAALLSD